MLKSSTTAYRSFRSGTATCDKLWSWRVSAGEMEGRHWRRESLGDYWGVVKFMGKEIDAIQKTKGCWQHTRREF